MTESKRYVLLLAHKPGFLLTPIYASVFHSECDNLGMAYKFN